MSDSDLFFPTCSDAARALTKEPANYSATYDELYHLLTTGQVRGAYQERRFWRIPVRSLRDLGFNPDTSLALHLPAKKPVKPLAVVSPQEAISPEEPSEDRKERIKLELLFILEKENRELELSLQAETRRADEAEKHLNDLRSVLDYATTPTNF